MLCFFLCKNPRQSSPEGSFGGVQKHIRESTFSGTFSSLHAFCTPPYHGPIGDSISISGAEARTKWKSPVISTFFRDAKMTIKIIFERSGQKGGRRGGVEKRVNRGLILKFYCRRKAQEKQDFGRSQFYCHRFFPRKYSDNNFGQLAPLHPPWGRTRGP